MQAQRMLTRLWRRLLPRPEPFVPPHDPWAGWERIVGMAADARPVQLVERLTFAQAEAIAGGMGGPWDALKAAMLPDDQLWRFTSSQDAWRARAGRSGVLLRRDGETVCIVATMVS